MAAALAGLLLSSLAPATAQAQPPGLSLAATSDLASSDADTAAPDQAPAGRTAKKAAIASTENRHVDDITCLCFAGVHGDLGYRRLTWVPASFPAFVSG